MKDIDKIKLLKEILNDKNLVSKKILKEEEPEGTLIVEAAGDSPEDAKKKMLKELKNVDLPDEEEMEEEYEDEEYEEDEFEDEEYEEEELEEEDFEMSDEDADIMDMIPESQRKKFKKRLLEKIKSM